MKEKNPHPPAPSPALRGEGESEIGKPSVEIRALARELRRTATSAERLLWEFVRARRLFGRKFRRQFPVGRFIADFACDDARLILELDGDVHANSEQRRHDTERDRLLRENGWTVLRFANDAVMRDTETVLSAISRHVQLHGFEEDVPHPQPLSHAGSFGKPATGEGRKSPSPLPPPLLAARERGLGGEGHLLPLTVADALAEAVKRLEVVETPRLDAQLLLCWTLKCRREDLARAPERPLSDRDALVFRKAVSLCAARRPLPYITGEAWFFGRPFKLNRAVLIPRPETEELAAWALEKMGENATAADIGTGSGILAVTLACERKNADVWASDISPDALKIAAKNVKRHGVGVTLLQGDLFAPFAGKKFDMIVSNPPYITENELLQLQPEVRDYEPTLALTGTPGATGGDGTALHQRMLSDAREFLTPGGWLLMEVGQGQDETVADAARASGYVDVTVRNDLAGIGRVVGGRWK